ncbi:hypothetical protein BGZ82_000454 [Podila clonocystis]|nr:hypothetical protein BGZ82_000454 [Podila clonocystis]
MSLGGGKSQAIDDAAGRLFAKNIPLIVAAGNSASTSACNQSPAGAANTYTVAASDSADKVATFSSYDLWTRCRHHLRLDRLDTISGTSMASPHVAGVGALYLSFNSIPTAQGLFNKLTQTATLNKITGNLNGSPNRLVFNGAV